MSGKPVVWGIGTSRTMRVHWTLAELGVDYETRPIEPRTGETQQRAFLALNPRGKIPVLEDGDFVLAESGAITHYLADRYREHIALTPCPGTRERARHDEWCYFALTELDATSLYVIRRHLGLPKIYGKAPKAIAAAQGYYTRQVEVAAASLADGRQWLLGETFTLADILFTTCLDWAALYGIEPFDVLGTYRGRSHRRAGYQAAFAQNFPPEVQAARLRSPGVKPLG